MLSNRDTICAVATPPGHGGIGVVRMSGPKAREILEKIWQGKMEPHRFESHKLYLGDVTSIDRAMVAWMQAPHSYTGDDVVEISSHGSPLILKKIVEACITAGARLAEPGEFTRRAFLAGKLDLVQAEAVADLINSTSEASARAAQDQLAGRLSQEVHILHEELLGLRTLVEATLDFPEEDIDTIGQEKIAERLGAVRARMERLAATFLQGRLIRDGVRVAIVGRPNVGKSSLLNRLAGSERAIVHATPGTTRDIVEVTVTIEGVAFHLADTAGLRDGEHEVERMGIARARDAMAHADLLVVVVDGSEDLITEDHVLLDQTASRARIVCVNKCDLTKRKQLPLGHAVSVSALTGAGINDLCAALAKMVTVTPQEGSGAIMTNLRHKEALDAAIHELQSASAVLDHRDSTELMAHHLRTAQEALGKITGTVTDDDLLNRIFSNFCIGK